MRSPIERASLALLALAPSAACAFDAPLLAPIDEAVDASAASSDAADDADSTSPPAPIALAAGGGQTYAIRRETLYGWGRNATGELGTGDTSSRSVPTVVARERRWTAVAAGDAFGCAIDSNRAVACWGDNRAGQLGAGDRNDRHVPTTVPSLAPARAIAAGGRTAYAILDDGSVVGWGDARDGELGAPAAGSRVSPVPLDGAHGAHAVAAGGAHACIVRDDGALACWGKNDRGQLGLGSDAGASVSTPTVVDGRVWVAVDCGGDSCCAVLADTSLWCWGDNRAGQLASPASNVPIAAPTRVATSDGWARVDVGVGAACARRIDGTLACWGGNDRGQLGLGDRTPRSTPSFVAVRPAWREVAVGDGHTCAVDATDATWCAGANGDGTLGTGDTVDRDIFTIASGP